MDKGILRAACKAYRTLETSDSDNSQWYVRLVAAFERVMILDMEAGLQEMLEGIVQMYPPHEAHALLEQAIVTLKKAVEAEPIYVLENCVTDEVAHQSCYVNDIWRGSCLLTASDFPPASTCCLCGSLLRCQPVLL